MESLLANLFLGVDVALSPMSLLYCLVGVSLGMLVGTLPGIGPLASISILLPLTFHIPPTQSIIMLAGIYYGANYGGSTASILLNIPGTPSAAVACLDGYPMAKQGRAGVALFMTTIASFIAGTVSIVLIAGFAPPLASVALSMSPTEYFSIMVLGLVAAATVSNGSQIKGIIMVAIGVLLGCIGIDVNSGVPRYTFGIVELGDGLSLVAISMGLFGIAEVIAMAGKAPRSNEGVRRISWKSMFPSREDWTRSWLPILRGSALGSAFGILPGTGSSVSSFSAYALEKQLAKEPQRFGRGAIEGLVAPEAANSSGSQAAFIPSITLGIPGDVVMALILGALIIHGITPGPSAIARHPDLFWGVVASFWIGNLMLLVLNIPLIGLWVRILTIPYRVLYPIVLVLICVGVYTIRNSVFDIWVAILFGALGYGLALLRFNPAPLLMGFILGPLMEQHFRRALLMSRGDLTVFLQRPLSLVFLIGAMALLVYSIHASRKQVGSP